MSTKNNNRTIKKEKNNKKEKQSGSAEVLIKNLFTSAYLLSDYRLESSLEDDLLSLPEIQEAPPQLEWLLQELTSLHEALSQDHTESSDQADWFALCSKLDVLLFRFYLFVLALYAGTLLLLWASWSFA